MATLSITIPDAAVPRIQEAFGHPASPTDKTWVNATNAELRDLVTAYLRARVRQYEEVKAADLARNQVTDF